MDHGRAVAAITQLEIASAKKVIRFDRRRLAERAARDLNQPFRSSWFRTFQNRIPAFDDGENIISMERDHFQHVAGPKFGKLELVAELAFGRFDIAQPVVHFLRYHDPEGSMQTGK